MLYIPLAPLTQAFLKQRKQCGKARIAVADDVRVDVRI